MAEEEQLSGELLQTMALFEQGLDQMKAKLEPLLALSSNAVAETLSPLDKAKLHVALAYAINSLCFMYLKTQGVSPASHPVKHELERIKGYVKKLKDIQNSGKPTEQPGMKVNVEAANRFIGHALAQQIVAPVAESRPETKPQKPPKKKHQK